MQVRQYMCIEADLNLSPIHVAAPNNADSLLLHNWWTNVQHR